MLNRDVKRLMSAYPRIYFACHTRHVRDETAGRTLSAHQASILDHLDEIEPTTLSGLARHMGVTNSTMSLAITRLVRDGYVSRRNSDQDGRQVGLILSPAGLRIRSQKSVLDPKRVKALLRQLAPAQREVALAGLEALAGAAATAVHRDDLHGIGKKG